LQKEDFVLVWDVQEGSEIVLGVIRDLEELLSSVGHLHGGEAGSVPVHELILGLLENSLREAARAGREVVDLLGFSLFNHGMTKLINDY
jgi:hypothetical protein